MASLAFGIAHLQSPALLSPVVPAHTHVLHTSLRFQTDPVNFSLSIHPSISSLSPTGVCIPGPWQQLQPPALVPSDPTYLQPGGAGLEGPDQLCTPGKSPLDPRFQAVLCPSAQRCREQPAPGTTAAQNELSPSLSRPFILQA